ncbi:MAG: L,D-transpeptidase [Chloroflexi bacterium]|nr:L,D-transpeptidase [Chloroflexota bacterium]
MPMLNRRDFIRYAGANIAGAFLPRVHPPEAYRRQLSLPAPLGRIATWWRQAVRAEPDPKASVVAYKSRDEIIPIYAALEAVPPWPTNPVWFETEGGYIHSGYVQPVADMPSGEVVQSVETPGFWAEVCVPVAPAYTQPGSSYATKKLYYGTVYRVIGALADDAGAWWYRLQEGITYTPGPYVLASSLRRIPPEDLTPISPERTDKWIEIMIDLQLLNCREGDDVVYTTRIASGLPATATPRGQHKTLLKRHAQRMIGGSGDDYYDLPGVAFPTYFTWSGVAIHGTYWHNDYGRRHSHGCVNVTNDAARWIFRWAHPIAPYTEYRVNATPESTMRVVVI